MKTALLILLTALPLSACSAAPMEPDPTTPRALRPPLAPAEGWMPAGCSRQHDVTTDFHNLHNTVTMRTVETFFFEDLEGEPESTLVRTCATYINRDNGCEINIAAASCIGDHDGPWPLCTVGFAGTDGAGAAVASCGSYLVQESFNEDGSVATHTETDNTREVSTRPF